MFRQVQQRLLETEHSRRLLSVLTPNNKTMHACHAALKSISEIGLLSSVMISTGSQVGRSEVWKFTVDCPTGAALKGDTCCLAVRQRLSRHKGVLTRTEEDF